MKFLAIFVFFLFSCSSPQPPAEKPIIAVYTAWKEKEFPLEKIIWDRFSHIAIASIYPLNDGNLDSALVDAFIEQLVDRAKEKNKKVILSVGGAGNASKAFKNIMAKSTTADIFVDNLIEYAIKHNVDGIDIDWEYWSYQSEQNRGGNDPIESQYLVDLLRLLDAKRPTSIMLTVDIAPGNWLGPQYKVELQNYVQYVNLMAFDFTGRWDESKIGHHADYRTFTKAINHSLKKGFHQEKLLVGLPTYGIKFLDSDNKEIEHISYNKIVQILDFDKKRLQKGKYQNIYFETEKILSKKTKYVVKKNLAGVFFFDLASDHTDEDFSLIESISTQIKIPNNEKN